jgi:hypothetical protein
MYGLARIPPIRKSPGHGTPMRPPQSSTWLYAGLSNRKRRMSTVGLIVSSTYESGYYFLDFLREIVKAGTSKRY